MAPPANDNTNDPPKDQPKTGTTQEVSQQALSPGDPNAATAGKGGQTDKVPVAAVTQDGSIDFGPPQPGPSDKATLDANGRVTEIALPNNQKRSFTYDRDGQLSSFTEPDGKKYELKNGKWMGPDGKPAGIETAMVSAQGDLVFTSSDKHIITRYADGHSQSIGLNDNSIVTTDTQNRVTSVHYGNGQSRSFEYGEDGKVNKITETDGQVYKLVDGKWLRPDGSNTFNADAKVLPDGTYSYKNGEGQIVSTNSENQQTIINRDGSYIKPDGQGRPAEIGYADGSKRQFTYDDKGNVTKITNGDGSTLTLQDGKWVDATGKDTGITDVRMSEGTLRYTTGRDVHFINGTGKEQIVNIDQMVQAAEHIHDAKDHKWGGISVFGVGKDDPETDKIWNILEPMSAAQRQVLAEQYQQKYGHKLTDDLKDKLSDGDGARVEALMNRRDGVADNAGTIHEALAKLKNMDPPYPGWVDDDRVRAEKEIRDAINTLTADQLREVEAKYKKDYGRDLQADLLNDKSLSAESKEALKVYFKGNDHRTDADTLALADLALKQHRPDIFDEVFRDATQSARDQFKANDGYKRIDQAFWDGADRQIAKDYLERGTVSIATIVDGDTHWYHTNKGDITRAMEHATEQDRKDFKRGEELALTGQSPQTPEDQRAYDFYRKVDKALHGAGNDRETALWEAKLRNNEGVIKDILDARDDGGWFGWGAHTDKNKLFGAVENMNKDDWNYLKQHPEELDKIDRALRTFDDSHREEIMNMLRTKLGAESWEKSTTMGNRDVEQRLKDSQNKPGARADALAGMSLDERQKYLNNTDGFRDKINGLLKSDQERFLADSIAHSKSAELTPVQKVIMDGIKNDDPVKTFNDIQVAFHSDATLRDRINNPMTDLDKKLAEYFKAAVNGAVDKAGLGDQTVSYGEGGSSTIPGRYDEYQKAIFETGTLPVDLKLQLTEDKTARTQIILEASPEERQRLLQENPDPATKAFQDRVLGTDKDKREVLLIGLRQEGLRPADEFRQFALGQGGNQDDLQAKIAAMTPEQRQDLANEYWTKYHRLITEDVIAKVNDSDRWRFREMLSPTDANVRQIALDAQHANNSHTSDWDKFLRDNWDYTRVAADSTQDNITKFIAEHAAELDKLTPAQRKQFDDAINNYREAQKNYINSKGEFAEAFVNATITVAAIGGAFFTGGTSLTLLAAIGAGGALYRIAVMKSIQGTDFDGSPYNLLKQGFEGGAAAMLGFLGPEQLGLTTALKVGDEVAVQAANKLITGGVTKSFFRAGSEQALKEGLADLTRQAAITGSEREIMALAEKFAAEGVDKNLVAQAIREAIQKETMTGLKNLVLNEGEAYVKNMLAAQIGGTGKEVAATLAGFESPDTFWERVKGTAVSTAAGVTFFHGIIRTATTGGDYIRYNIGRDAQGNFYAGEGMTIRHSDGTLETVGKEPVKMAPGDTVYEKGSYKANPDGTSDLKVGDRVTTYDQQGNATLIKDTVTGKTTEISYTVDPTTNKPVVDYVISKNADGSWNKDMSFYRAADGDLMSYSGKRPYGTHVEVAPDGSLTFSGKGKNTTIGEPREQNNSSTALEKFTVRPDGSTEKIFADGNRTNYDPLGRPDEMISAKGERFQYEFDQNTWKVNRVQIGTESYTRRASDGMLIDKNGKPFAKDILVYSDGSMKIYPTEDFRVAGHPNEVVSEFSETVTGRTVVKFRDSTNAPTDTNNNPPRSTEQQHFQRRVDSGDVVKQSDGTYLHTDSSGAKVTYDANGEVTSIRTADGRDAHVTRDANGLTKVEYTRNGQVESTFTKRADGVWEEHDASGKVVGEYHDVKVDPDGSVTRLRKTTDTDTDWTGVKERPDGLKVEVDKVGRERVSQDELARERTRVTEAAREAFKGNPEQKERFEKWMQDFEKRAADRQPPLSQEEIANTYYQLDKLLTTPNSYMSLQDRTNLAEMFMYKAANPHTIGQGQFNTCNVTAEIENRFITAHPSEALDMISQVATTGRYVDATGNVIDMTLMKNVLTPFGKLEQGFDPANYQGRDFFDQIFQSTSIETYWQSQGTNPTSNIWQLRAGQPFHPGDLRYEFTTQPGHSNTGEVINNYGTNPPTRQLEPKWVMAKDPVTGEMKEQIEWVPAASPNLPIKQLQDIGRRILGRTEAPHIVAMEGVDPDAISIKTVEDLQKTLSDMQKTGVFPATIELDSRAPLLGGNGQDGGYGGPHVINVQKIYQNAEGKWMVEFTNQWTSATDHIGESRAVPLEDLHDAMRMRKPAVVVTPEQKSQVLEYLKYMGIGAGGAAATLGAAYEAWRLLNGQSLNPFDNNNDPAHQYPNGSPR